MIRNINRVTLLGKVREIHTEKNNVITFFMSTIHNWKDKVTCEIRKEVELHRVTCYKYLFNKAVNVKEGDIVFVEGQIKTEKFKNINTGIEHAKTGIKAIDIFIL